MRIQHDCMQGTEHYTKSQERKVDKYLHLSLSSLTCSEVPRYLLAEMDGAMQPRLPRRSVEVGRLQDAVDVYEVG